MADLSRIGVMPAYNTVYSSLERLAIHQGGDSDSRGGVSGLGGRFKLRLFEDGGDMFQVCMVKLAWTHAFGIWAKEWHEPLIVKIEVGQWEG